MRSDCVDLYVQTPPSAELLELAQDLGWGGLCFVKRFAKKDEFSSHLKLLSKLADSTQTQLFSGALLDKIKHSELQKRARPALDAGSVPMRVPTTFPSWRSFVR